MSAWAASLLRALVLLPALALTTSAAPPPPPATVAARALARYPHDTNAFTEGLFVRDGRLYESTGYEGRSNISEIELTSGRVLRRTALPPGQFGEGATDFGAEIYSVTWQGGIGHRWRLRDFRRLGGFRYDGEGWGLTQDGRNLILSDGTATLRFLDPRTLRVVRRINVTDGGVRRDQLNELEYVEGEILANVWHDDRIARIDPHTGRIKGWIDLSEIVAATPRRDPEAVLNGIAWDKRARKLYVTGKLWPAIYQIAWPPR